MKRKEAPTKSQTLVIKLHACSMDSIGNCPKQLQITSSLAGLLAGAKLGGKICVLIKHASLLLNTRWVLFK